MILAGTSQGSSDYYYEEEDSQFLEALNSTVLPGDLPPNDVPKGSGLNMDSPMDEDDEEIELPQPAQSSLKRRHSSVVPDSEDEDERKVQEMPKDDTYDAYKFGGFGDYMRRKRAKLQIQNAQMVSVGESAKQTTGGLFQGLAVYVSCPSLRVKGT